MSKRGMLIVLGLCGTAPSAFAGMPVIHLTDVAEMRLQAISFFVVAILVLAIIVKWLWNSLRVDFPKLPVLSYPRALALTILWGLFFLLILSMISGARELLTPGAWKKDGYIYRLEE